MSLSENQVMADNDLRRSALVSFSAFSGNSMLFMAKSNL
jgi:hypothetical protein